MKESLEEAVIADAFGGHTKHPRILVFRIANVSGGN